MSHERRRRRSAHMRQAVHYQLASCAENYGVPSLSLGDERGLMVGGAGLISTVDEALVAFAPLLCRAHMRTQRTWLVQAMREVLPELRHRHVSVRRFQVGGESLYLCALGRRGSHKEVAMNHAITGLRRILAR